MTLGTEFRIKRVGNHVIQIWDLAGQPIFSSVRSTYYVGALGAILVYDITQPTSFSNVINWVREICKHTNQNFVSIIVLANKIDLKSENPNSIDYSDGKALIEEISSKELNESIEVHFMETSAKTGENVSKAFDTIIEITYNQLLNNK